jgi:hypothetical protein
MNLENVTKSNSQQISKCSIAVHVFVCWSPTAGLSSLAMMTSLSPVGQQAALLVNSVACCRCHTCGVFKIKSDQYTCTPLHVSMKFTALSCQYGRYPQLLKLFASIVAVMVLGTRAFIRNYYYYYYYYYYYMNLYGILLISQYGKFPSTCNIITSRAVKVKKAIPITGLGGL